MNEQVWGPTMGLIEILANVVLFTTIGTLIVGIVAYFSYKLRERRKPRRAKKRQLDSQSAPPLVVRYVPPARDPDIEDIAIEDDARIGDHQQERPRGFFRGSGRRDKRRRATS